MGKPRTSPERTVDRLVRLVETLDAMISAAREGRLDDARSLYPAAKKDNRAIRRSILSSPWHPARKDYVARVMPRVAELDGFGVRLMSASAPCAMSDIAIGNYLAAYAYPVSEMFDAAHFAVSGDGGVWYDRMRRLCRRTSGDAAPLVLSDGRELTPSIMFPAARLPLDPIPTPEMDAFFSRLLDLAPDDTRAALDSVAATLRGLNPHARWETVDARTIVWMRVTAIYSFVAAWRVAHNNDTPAQDWIFGALLDGLCGWLCRPSDANKTAAVEA